MNRIGVLYICFVLTSLKNVSAARNTDSAPECLAKTVAKFWHADVLVVARD